MGMFDTIRVVDYPLPDDIVRKDYQTKDLECYLENYEIRSDGCLWHELYDTEDHSDPAAEGVMRFAGIFTRVNTRWVRDPFTGNLDFYDFDDDLEPHWVEFHALLQNGMITQIERIIRSDD